MARGGDKVRRQGGLTVRDGNDGSEDRRRQRGRPPEAAGAARGYLVANGKFDWPAIEPIWSQAPHATFFNLNGHTYNGAAHWSRLWAFYIQNVKGSYWTPYEIGGEVGSDMAVIWCHRRCQRNGSAPASSRRATSTTRARNS